MNFPFYIAKRYLFSKSSNNAINVITGIAAVGVVVGAMSLFIVLSGFSGLKDFSLQFTNVFDSDLKVYPASGKTLSFDLNSEKNLKQIEGIAAYSKVIEERVFLQYKGKNHIAYLKGVDENFSKVNPVDSILFLSEWFKPGLGEVVVGTGTAVKLSLGIRDYTDLLEIYVPNPGTGQITELNIQNAFTKDRVVVSGFYEVNEDINSKYVFADIDMARALLNRDSTAISSLEIKLSPDVSEENIREQLIAAFSTDVLIKNRIQQNDALYKMLNTENIAVYLIFTLVLIIALFNVIGSIIMMILDKRKNIKTLYNLGATLKEIRSIFFVQGTLMTTLGGLFGIFLGVIAVVLQLQFEFVKITSTLPYPVKLSIVNIAVVFITISLLGIIASKIASSRVRAKLIA
ncbi:ABC transporter permease [Constantimarinum furrinae]|uniref:Lipoprotein-releasing system permease protein n=1 Tax=Constantimarinum furrinae TaxID=2562285 RepID=A0A7G8PT60_9FLAO|nr:FtsX-like permease family protein [Constantimarinum furrinae]QNJ97526.1 lipoprotein-releasing system permease protein [Constantimarinum furrinae]